MPWPNIALPTPPACSTISPGTSFAVSTSRWSRAGCRTSRTASVAQRVLAHTLDTLLRLLHPMIPFLTEDVWQRLGEVAPERGIDESQPAAESIMLAPWPECDPTRQDPEIEAQFARFQEVLRAVRDIRARQGVAPKTPLAFSVRCDAAVADLLAPDGAVFRLDGQRPGDGLRART